MSVEELVKRLRHSDEYEPLGHDGWEAADKLEELAAALAEKNKALDLAEFMLTKDSLCQSERLEEGLTVIRRARNAGGNDAE